MSFLGCSGKTTDPHKGGLFSYNPSEYDKRIEARNENLKRLKEATIVEQSTTQSLEDSKESQTLQNTEFELKISALSLSIATLDDEIRTAQIKTDDQAKMRDRILKEVDQLKSSFKLADELEDTELKLQELENLKKRRDELEEEVQALMLL